MRFLPSTAWLTFMGGIVLFCVASTFLHSSNKYILPPKDTINNLNYRKAQKENYRQLLSGHRIIIGTIERSPAAEWPSHLMSTQQEDVAEIPHGPSPLYFFSSHHRKIFPFPPCPRAHEAVLVLLVLFLAIYLFTFLYFNSRISFFLLLCLF